MKIKLIRTGGIIPITKAAEAEVEITAHELEGLLEKIQPDSPAGRIKDGNYYELTAGNSRTPVDLEKIPDEYKALFSKLKSDLKIISNKKGPV
jgi:hypothetical protein